MPLFNSQHHNDCGIRWRGIATTVVVELLVLLALTFAVVRYVEWSSDTAQAEFMSATKPSASDPNYSANFLLRFGPSRCEPIATGRVELLTLQQPAFTP